MPGCRLTVSENGWEVELTLGGIPSALPRSTRRHVRGLGGTGRGVAPAA